MTDQSTALQYLHEFRTRLEELRVSDDALAPFVDGLQDVEDQPDGNATHDLDHPLMARLNGALGSAKGSPALVEAVTALAHEGGFFQVYEGEGINATQADYMIGKQIIGPKGRLSHDSLRAGIFVLAPNFEYLMHSHEALELYYVHSGNMHVQNGTDAEKRAVGPGDYSVTPSSVPHALHIGDEPVVILYIWTGALTAPIMWWTKEDDGSWTQSLAKDLK
ncbi:MAG: cupin domain-containing protein [Rhodospirillales bacterium]|jgi:quercetin dioxygenase-like cupin family protein|nr:cupin domain-containing protein [Rhodospirillales bacterium]MBT4040773.1 cupin domain-containing protein [Rhodospirillales bacterium]MBT4628022.1 cupin domain-containing protein [Rhodospirillales bacterium]MBT5351698.1 cupin domain-containing protein [Rhodospirillales bacterium]MBT5520882.1 cupin domain-containing protein [Rhodospirillales bacterium]